jgi:glutamyl-tRNA synthetase
MAKEFDLHKVHKAGARFSKEKAEWFNHQYIQRNLMKNFEYA